MKAQLIAYRKVIDELGNIIEIKVWQLPKPPADKPHGYRYSVVYISDDIRVIGYDNAEGKGDHRHYGKTNKSYKFKSIDRLLEDFYNDIERYKQGGKL
ncbi:MAG: DUF6516 family protein [Nitrospirota bacterium]